MPPGWLLIAFIRITIVFVVIVIVLLFVCMLYKVGHRKTKETVWRSEMLVVGCGWGVCFGRCMKSGNEWKKEILGKHHCFLDLAFWCAASLSYLIFLFYLFGSMFASFFWLLLCRMMHLFCAYIYFLKKICFIHQN